jgi:hypothetical protein
MRHADLSTTQRYINLDVKTASPGLLQELSEGKAMNMEKAFEQFLTALQVRSYSPHTLKAYKTAFDEWDAFQNGDVRLSQFTRQKIGYFLEHLIAGKPPIPRIVFLQLGYCLPPLSGARFFVPAPAFRGSRIFVSLLSRASPAADRV